MDETETPDPKTREETLARLARNSSEGARAAKRFESLVKRVLKTPKSEIDQRAKEWKEARKIDKTE